MTSYGLRTFLDVSAAIFLAGCALAQAGSGKLGMRGTCCFLMSMLTASVLGSAFSCALAQPGPATLRMLTPITALSPPRATYSDLPRPYLGISVTSALFKMDASKVTAYDGADKDNVIMDMYGQGPVLWSVSRWNQGDFAPRIAPRHPYAQTNLNQEPGTGGYSSDDPRNFSTQAWRPSIDKGVLLATVAQNSQEWNDGAGKFYGTVACVYDSQGFGYSMRTGEYGNSNPNLDVTVGKAGAKGEGNIDVAVAWFPYDQGWIGGYVDAPSEYAKSATPDWVFRGSHSPNLPEDASRLIKWSKRGATLSLPGVTADRDGMLFLTSTDPGDRNNDLNVLGAYTKHRGTKWRIQAREDSVEDPQKLVDSSEHMFAFLFIPFSAAGLIGGKIGAKGNVVRGAGSFVVRRLDTGVYNIRIQNEIKSPQDGMVLLQVTGRDVANHKYAHHAFLSYNYTSDGALQVEAHTLRYIQHEAGFMEETFPFVDTDFSFAWVDFRHPLTPQLAMFTGRLPHKFSSMVYWMGFLVGVFIASAATLAAAWLAQKLGYLPASYALSFPSFPSLASFHSFSSLQPSPSEEPGVREPLQSSDPN